MPDAGAPGRGDVIGLDFTPQRGHEPAGRRPALVLSPRAYNDRVGLAIVCPITNQQKRYPFEVDIPEGYSVTGVILADQVKSMDWRARNGQKRGRLPQQTVDRTLYLISTLLDESAAP